ncbi:MAG: VWA domain-containing protein [Wenzhouxiangellaceae bacterium]
MDRRNRPGLTFSLSFLDVMSVGLGSVILIFLIINHATEVRSREATAALVTEVEQLQGQFDAREATAEALASAIEAAEERLQGARTRLSELQRLAERADDSAGDPDDVRARAEQLQEEVRALEARLADLRREAEQQRADSVFTIAGEGRRQYLSGLEVDGQRILLLVDISASMLAEQIVDVIRIRNMNDAAIRAAAKWNQAREAAAWLAAQIPTESRFQLYVFNDRARSVLADTDGRWLEVGDGGPIRQALAELEETRPNGATSLHNAFSAALALNPRPDNIILITDHTPTVGSAGGGRGRVTARHRQRLFGEAVGQIPSGIPVNVILLPMEGDPMAASLFWQLARITGGVLITPSADWP